MIQTDARPRSPIRPRRLEALASSFPFQCALLAATFFAYREVLVYLMRFRGLTLVPRFPGRIISYRLFVPLHAVPELSLSLWLLPAAAVLAGYLILSPRLLLSSRVRPVQLLAGASATLALIAASVAMIDGYRTREGVRLPALIEPYSHTHLDYFGDVPKVDKAGGPWEFLRKYPLPRVFDRLALHPKTHPPGGVLFLWLVSRIFGHNLWSASLATLAVSTLALWPAYGLGRLLYGEAAARHALALLLVAPSLVMFTATSMDGPFMVFPLLGLYLVYRSLTPGGGTGRRGISLGHAVLAGLCLGLGMFMTYATTFFGLFFAVLVVLSGLQGRERLWLVFRALAVAGISFCAFYGLLFLLVGFDPFAAVRASLDFARELMGTGRESLGRYFHVSVCNLLIFLFYSGVPLAVVWLRELAVVVRRRERQPSDLFVVGFAVSLLIIGFANLFTLEVERIWLFMVPLLAIPAGQHLVRASESGERLLGFRWVAGLMAVQLLALETTLRTAW